MPYSTSLKVQVATVVCQGPGVVIPGVDDGTPGNLNLTRVLNRGNKLSPCQAYQNVLTHFSCPIPTPPDILVMVHDDVTVHDDDWLPRVLELFSNSECVAVGLGGATHLGHPNLYKRPYRLQDMARGGYVSNQTDWEVHGGHEVGAKRVAVLDAFFMAVRTQFLLDVGGWPVQHLTHHGLDLWLACMAARHGKETWMTGCSVTHHGGGTSIKPEYGKAKWLQGGTLEKDHQSPHEFLYSEFRDCLPLDVTR